MYLLFFQVLVSPSYTPNQVADVMEGIMNTQVHVKFNSKSVKESQIAIENYGEGLTRKSWIIHWQVNMTQSREQAPVDGKIPSPRQD